MTRIKVKGRYREITRDYKGRFLTVRRWSSKMSDLPNQDEDLKLSIEDLLDVKEEWFICPHCGFGHPINGETGIYCPHCGESTTYEYLKKLMLKQ